MLKPLGRFGVADSMNTLQAQPSQSPSKLVSPQFYKMFLLQRMRSRELSQERLVETVAQMTQFHFHFYLMVDNDLAVL